MQVNYKQLIASCLGLGCLLTPLASAGTLNLRGIMLDDQGVLFSLHRTDTGEAIWLSPDKPYHGLDIISFDARTGLLVVNDHGQTIALRLPDTSVRDNRPAAAEIVLPEQTGPSEEAQAIAALERLRTLPKDHPLYAKLIQAGESRLQGSTVQAKTTTVEPAENPDENQSDQPSVSEGKEKHFVLIGRQRNAVNSRVYASDHIAEFGLPPDLK